MVKTRTKTNKPQAKPSFVSEKPKSAPVKAGKKPLSFGEKTGTILAMSVCAVFAVFAAYILITTNSDLLFQAQNYSFFNSTTEYFNDCMKLPGGIITFVATFFTQFFYEPWMGATILIALWAAIFYVSKKAMRVSSVWACMMLVPVAALLTSVIDTAYWIYYIKQPGYWFYGTVGFLISMLMTWAMQISKNTIYRIILAVAIACTYPLFGWYTLLALIYSAFVHMNEKGFAKSSALNKIVLPVLAIALAVATPYICYNFYSNIRLEGILFTGLYYFESDNLSSFYPFIPFIILCVWPILMAFMPKEKKLTGGKAMAAYIVNAVLLYGCFHFVVAGNFQDVNYHTGMRMYRAIEEQQWDKALDEIGNLPTDASREMVLFKNIALLNKGEMGSKMFKYNNMGNNPRNPYDSLQVHMVQTGAPLIYMNHAKTNFAIRWCIENGVEFGPRFNEIKIMTQCALINQEMDVARKYLNIMKNTMFYKDWAEHYMPLVDNPKLLNEYHEFDVIRELRNNMGTVLDGDQGLCEMYLLSYFSNTINKDSQLLEELTLNYAMVQKDIQLFWPRFFLYANMHKSQEMPIHYQEAAYLYGNLEHQVDVSSMPFDKTKVLERYDSFQQISQSLLASGMTPEQVGESMKASFGDTFWWFYFFCRDIHSY